MGFKPHIAPVVWPPVITLHYRIWARHNHVGIYLTENRSVDDLFDDFWGKGALYSFYSLAPKNPDTPGLMWLSVEMQSVGYISLGASTNDCHCSKIGVQNGFARGDLKGSHTIVEAKKISCFLSVIPALSASTTYCQYSVFTTPCYASVVLAVIVCPSIRLSHAGIVSK